MGEEQYLPVLENLTDLNSNIKEEKVQSTNNLVEINDKAWKCNMCEKVIVSMLNLRRHLGVAHKVILSPGQCHLEYHQLEYMLI